MPRLLSVRYEKRRGNYEAVCSARTGTYGIFRMAWPYMLLVRLPNAPFLKVEMEGSGG
jgi:hypothetical protein